MALFVLITKRPQASYKGVNRTTYHSSNKSIRSRLQSIHLPSHTHEKYLLSLRTIPAPPGKSLVRPGRDYH